MALSLSALEHFLLVAEHGSLSGASSVAGVAQTTLGRHIQQVEVDVGCRLFYRNGRGVSLTQEGKLYLQRVQPLLSQLRAASDELRVEGAEVSGEVVVGMPPVPLELLGLPLLSSVREEFPRIRINLMSAYSGHIDEWVGSGRLDIAILHDARRSRHIQFDPLAACDLYLISAPAALTPAERARPAVEFAEVANYRLVLPSRLHGLRRTLDAAAEKARVTTLIDFEIDTLALTKSQVLGGTTHTVLALPAVVSEVNASQLVARRITNPVLRTSLGLVTATHRPFTRAMRAVLDLVRREMKIVIEKSGQRLGVHASD